MADYHLVVPMEVTTSREESVELPPSPQKVAKPQTEKVVAQLDTPTERVPHRSAQHPGVTQIRRQEERTATQDTPTPQADQPTNKDGSTLAERGVPSASLPTTLR